MNSALHVLLMQQFHADTSGNSTSSARQAAYLRAWVMSSSSRYGYNFKISRMRVAGRDQTRNHSRRNAQAPKTCPPTHNIRVLK